MFLVHIHGLVLVRMILAVLVLQLGEIELVDVLAVLGLLLLQLVLFLALHVVLHLLLLLPCPDSFHVLGQVHRVVDVLLVLTLLSEPDLVQLMLPQLLVLLNFLLGDRLVVLLILIQNHLAPSLLRCQHFQFILLSIVVLAGVIFHELLNDLVSFFVVFLALHASLMNFLHSFVKPILTAPRLPEPLALLRVSHVLLIVRSQLPRASSQ